MLLPRAVYGLSALGFAGVALERGLGPGERGLRWALSLLPTVALLQGERGLLCLAAGFVQGLVGGKECGGTMSGRARVRWRRG